jgi:hypothetical protein
MKPRIQCVLTQWLPGSMASGSGPIVMIRRQASQAGTKRPAVRSAERKPRTCNLSSAAPAGSFDEFSAYPPIADYAFLSDCEVTALVGAGSK